MPVRQAERPNRDVADWIENTYARRLTPSDIPSPLGRTQAGWGDMRIKLAPEVHTMIERLLEHPALRGKFETKGHVGWMLIHLGTAAVYRFLQDNWREHDDIVDSITYRLATVQRERARIEEREAVVAVIDISKSNIKNYLDWGTAEGKYKAWKLLKSAFDARAHAPSLERYDQLMSGSDPLRLGRADLVQVERYYDKLMRGLEEDVYLELTQEYYDELDHEREGR